MVDTQRMPVVSEKEARILIDQLSVPHEERDQKRIKKIKECLENVKFLKQYSDSPDFEEVVKNLDLENLEQEQVLFKQGDNADKFYIILTGCIGLYINIINPNNEKLLGQGVKEIAKLYSGDSFGEIGLLYNEQRTATALCLEQTILISLNKQIFDKYLSNTKNEKLDTMISYYKNLWVLRSLHQKEVLKLATKTTLTKCNSNTIIIRQGEKPKGIYFINNGIIKIIQTMKYRINPETEEILDDYRDPTPEQIKNKLYKTVDMELDELGNGSYFCDYEVFNNVDVHYNAVSITPCDIMTISYYDLKFNLNPLILKDMQENAKFFPSAEQIKKKYFENLMWKNYKAKALLHFNHEILNKDRSKQNRVPYLQKIDLNNFKIYEDVDQQFELQYPNPPKQAIELNDNIQKRTQTEGNKQEKQQQNRNSSVQPSKNKKQKERQKAEFFLKQQYQKQQIEKKQKFRLLDQKGLSSKSLSVQQIQQQQQYLQQKQQSQKILFPKINTKSTIFNLVNQIY